MFCKTEVLQKFRKFYKKVSVTELLLNKTVSIHALSPQTYNCTSKDTITVVFLWMYVKIFFHCFISHKYVFTDILQNRCSWKFRKIPRKSALPDCLDSDTDVFLRIFWNLRNAFFIDLWTTVSNFNSTSYCFRTFLFQNRSIFI